MNPSTLEADEALVAELYRLGVRHLARLSASAPERRFTPSDLIAALARHPLARFRASLILLFLRQPQWWEFVPTLTGQLEREARLALKMYYQAAVYLQCELAHRPTFKPPTTLPDLFSKEFGLPAVDSLGPGPESAEAALMALGETHARLSGRAYNWAGSYRQNIPRFLKQLELERSTHD
jgi:hypothetical protein